MSETNGNSKWVMWAVGIMLTIGMAAQGAQYHYVNARFQSHDIRPHVGAVSKNEFDFIYNELKEIRNEVKKLQEQVARLEEKLKTK